MLRRVPLLEFLATREVTLEPVALASDALKHLARDREAEEDLEAANPARPGQQAWKPQRAGRGSSSTASRASSTSRGNVQPCSCWTAKLRLPRKLLVAGR